MRGNTVTSKEAKAMARATLSEKRYTHTVNVKKIAVKLAKRNGVEKEQAALAEADGVPDENADAPEEAAGAPEAETEKND